MFDNSGGPSFPQYPQNDKAGADPKQLDKVRDILNAFGNAVSAMKIFPSDHLSVKKFAGDMTAKIQAFLEFNDKLEIGIKEFGFTYMDKPVYRDEMSIKSLPFFFFKDGMQALYFFQSIEHDEIMEFLELIKRESQKPADEGDIVNALWERDLANIQYYAPDDFLEIKILEEQSDLAAKEGLSPEEAAKLLDVDVDMSRLNTGKIELAPEDREDLTGLNIDKEKAPDKEIEPESVAKRPKNAPNVNFNENEVQEINSLIQINRTITAEEEFLNLMIEIIYLVNDLIKYSENLDLLYEFHLEHIQKGNFRLSTMMMKKLLAMRPSLGRSWPEKDGLLEDFLKKVTGENTLRILREYFEKEAAVDDHSLLEFLMLIGPTALPLAADMYESSEARDFQSKALDYFWSSGRQDAALVTDLANDSRPSLSKEIIGFLRRSSDPKASSCLAAFLRFSNKNLRLEAVRALGDIGGETANKILMGFLSDPEETLRIEAALRIRWNKGDRSPFPSLIKIIKDESFGKKSSKEKKALFSLLGRTETEEAYQFLRKTLFRISLFPWSRRRLELRLSAVSGLESMATPQALEALRRGAAARNKKVRTASSLAMTRLMSIPTGKNTEERDL